MSISRDPPGTCIESNTAQKGALHVQKRRYTVLHPNPNIERGLDLDLDLPPGPSIECADKLRHRPNEIVAPEYF